METEVERRDRTRVAIIGDLPAENRVSMMRFARTLHGKLSERTGTDATLVEGPPLSHHLTMGKFQHYWDRFVRYPLALRAMDQSGQHVFHIIDHGYADLVRWLPRDQTVITCHDVTLLKAQTGELMIDTPFIATKRFKWSMKALHQAARIVAVSESTKRDLIRLLDIPENMISVIPNGVSANFSVVSDERRNKVRVKLGLENRDVIMSVSTGQPYKNVNGTLDVIAELKSRKLSPILMRVGVPLSQKEIAYSRKLDVFDDVRDLGFVTEEELIDCYNISNVLLFPSLYEGFGWPPLEAMACGTPVVSSDCDAVAEVVSEAGLIASATDSAKLADHAQLILESGAVAAELTAAGLERSKQFSWDRAARSYEELYEVIGQ